MVQFRQFLSTSAHAPAYTARLASFAGTEAGRDWCQCNLEGHIDLRVDVVRFRRNVRLSFDRPVGAGLALSNLQGFNTQEFANCTERLYEWIPYLCGARPARCTLLWMCAQHGKKPRRTRVLQGLRSGAVRRCTSEWMLNSGVCWFDVSKEVRNSEKEGLKGAPLVAGMLNNFLWRPSFGRVTTVPGHHDFSTGTISLQQWLVFSVHSFRPRMVES